MIFEFFACFLTAITSNKSEYNLEGNSYGPFLFIAKSGNTILGDASIFFNELMVNPTSA
ncbi:MAG: hypothetical protein ACJA1Z_000207 [Patiriisocius sp.]